MQNGLSGIAAVTAAVLVAAAEWGGGRAFYLMAGLPVLIFLIVVTPRVPRSRQIFVAIAVILMFIALVMREDWAQIAERAMWSATFVMGFFVALAWLRAAAGSSPAIERCGRFLADQPPGRRYLALTVGGHLFGLMLLYGAISLLGTMAEVSARRETNEEVRRIRLRRMLLAVQRGFVSTLSWSPLTFSIAITTSKIPGGSWAGVVAAGSGTAIMLAVLGWVMDKLYKPRLSGPSPARIPPDGSWALLLPLVLLLVTLFGGVVLLTSLTDLRAVAVVMVLVPVISISWMAIQAPAERKLITVSGRIKRFVTSDIAEVNGELVLLIMAGFIGTAGAMLLAPYADAAGLDFSLLPAWVILLMLLWSVPITGQLGMNPILVVSLLAPLLPTAETMGLSPDAVVLAIISGWALSGASSPYTATTLLAGSVAGVSAHRVGLVWNGSYTLIGGCLASIWVIAIAGWL